MLGRGELCALLSPLVWAFAVILFKRSAHAPAGALNLFKNMLAFVLLSLTMLAFGTAVPMHRSGSDWAALALSGVLGLAVADTLLFAGLRLIGAARMAVADTVYAPVVVTLSWIFLGERPGGWFIGGAAAVLVGVTLAAVSRRAFLLENAAERRNIVVGSLLVVAAISGTAVGVVLVKPILGGADLIEVTWTRLMFGLVVQVAWTAIRGELGSTLAALRPGPLWTSLVPAAVLGPYASLLLWLGGFKWADASVAAVLNQMATIYVLILARVWLKESLSAQQVAGALLACGGALLIVVGG